MFQGFRMPQKNSVKIYYENGIYHVYNRGVEKRDIFLDRDDYLTFLHLLKTALMPPEIPQFTEKASQRLLQGSTLKWTVERLRKNFYGKIDLFCYNLMPNHYHFLLKQIQKTSITEFIHSISTTYCMYFNKKHQRVGSLFQGIFKAVDVAEDNYLIWLSRYIHRNHDDFQNYPYSSYADYLGKRNTPWLNKKFILDYFESHLKSQEKNYQTFVEAEKEEPLDIGNLYLETE